MPNEKKTYCNAMWLTERTFEGGEVIKVSIKADKMIEFLNQHKNEKGYVRLDIFRRRERGQNGETHSASLDTWKPDPNRQQQTSAKREQKPSEASGDFKEPNKTADGLPVDDDVPF